MIMRSTITNKQTNVVPFISPGPLGNFSQVCVGCEPAFQCPRPSVYFEDKVAVDNTCGEHLINSSFPMSFFRPDVKNEGESR